MTTEFEPHGAGLFDALPVTDDDANARPHARLAADAERDGVLDVAYRTISTRVGELLLAATGRGLVRVAYPRQGHDSVLAKLADAVSPRILHAPGQLDQVSKQLEEYFAGRRTTFDVPLGFRLSQGSAASCWRTCPRFLMGAQRATPRSPPRRGTRRQSARLALPARRTRCL